MQTLDLCDEIEVLFSEKDHITCSDPSIPQDERNLAWKALDLFRRETGYSFSLSINIDKKIPAEAGLGGGSSNAATVLKALNALHNHPLSPNDLMALGARIGSDVPFFFTSGMAFATGRGEILQEVNIPKLPLKIVKPNFGLSTSLVYAHAVPQKHPSPFDLLESFKRGTPHLINDLEIPAFKLHPELKEFKDSLQQNGHRAIMTGSGTAFIVLT